MLATATSRHRRAPHVVARVAAHQRILLCYLRSDHLYLGNRATQQLIISSVHYRSIGLDTEKIFVREYITGSILQLSVSCVNIWVYSRTNFPKHSQGYWACWELPDNQYRPEICTLYLIRYYVIVTGLNNDI